MIRNVCFVYIRYVGHTLGLHSIFGCKISDIFKCDKIFNPKNIKKFQQETFIRNSCILKDYLLIL